jgi:hypothetical protein
VVLPGNAYSNPQEFLHRFADAGLTPSIPIIFLTSPGAVPDTRRRKSYV